MRGRQTALTICEDAWNDKQFWEHRLYLRDPVEELAQSGAEMLLSINASPYHMGKRELRREMFARAGAALQHPGGLRESGRRQRPARLRRQQFRHGRAGQRDRLGRIVSRKIWFSSDIDSGSGDLHENLSDECEAVYEALVLGTRDYIRKCGFRKVLIGLSGGIDSSLTAAIAVDAVGRENVTGVGMPGPFSSDHSVTDARDMARESGHPLRDGLDHADVRPVSSRRCSPCFAGRRRMSPKKICNRACAASR